MTFPKIRKLIIEATGQYHHQTLCGGCGKIIEQHTYAGFDEKGYIRCVRCYDGKERKD